MISFSGDAMLLSNGSNAKLLPIALLKEVPRNPPDP